MIYNVFQKFEALFTFMTAAQSQRYLPLFLTEMNKKPIESGFFDACLILSWINLAII